MARRETSPSGWGRGDGSFGGRRAYKTAEDVFDVDVTDINGDGKPDLIAAGASPKGPITVLLNAGAGRFRRDRVARSGGWAWVVTATDVNRDGLIDVVVGGDGARDLALLLRRANGGFAAPICFAAVGGELGVSGIDTADVNGDGNIDLVVAGNDRVASLLGHGDGTFEPPSTLAALRDAEGPGVTDVTRDGRLDLVVAGASRQGGRVVVLVGRGGAFAPGVASPFGPGSYGLVVTDMDGDGPTSRRVAPSSAATVMGPSARLSRCRPGSLGTAPSPARSRISTSTVAQTSRSDLETRSAISSR